MAMRGKKKASGNGVVRRKSGLGPKELSAAEIVTLNWGDIMLMAKITGKKVNLSTGQINLEMMPYDDTIHPYPLDFEPPLVEYAQGSGKGFRHHWEKLAYVFELPNPYKFRQLPVSNEEDRENLRRFVAMCKRLAGYTTINGDGGLRLSKTQGGGDWTVEVDFPSQEAFGGTSVAFRQLHSGKDSASFDVVKGILFKAARTLPEADQDEALDVLTQWASARGRLMNQLLSTAVCMKAAPNTPPDDFPISFRNIKPEELLLDFNYGDTIHFTERRENLAALLEDERNEAYYKHAVVKAIIGLSHLYFGFAVLIESAMAP